MSTPSDAAAAADFIKSAGYELAVTINAASGINFGIKVFGEDGGEYNLKSKQYGDPHKEKLVRTLLHRIADAWTGPEFEFRADGVHTITEVR